MGCSSTSYISEARKTGDPLTTFGLISCLFDNPTGRINQITKERHSGQTMSIYFQIVLKQAVPPIVGGIRVIHFKLLCLDVLIPCFFADSATSR